MHPHMHLIPPIVSEWGKKVWSITNRMRGKTK
jgi:hypothetical protein